MTPIPSPFYSSGSGSHRLYVVEARLTGSKPAELVNGILLTREWQRVHTHRTSDCALVEAGRISVPATSYPAIAAEHELLEREAAYALAVRFQVESGIENSYCAGHAILCIETRLVEVELAYSFSITEKGVCEPFSLFEHLRHLKSMPREVVVARPPGAER